MIEAAQRKRREAHSNFDRLYAESKKIVTPNPEAFQHCLSAFLSSARSVTFTIQAEEKEKYGLWFPGWLSGLLEDDRELMKFMNEQRVAEVHRKGAETSVEWEAASMFETLQAGVEVFGPPGTEKLGAMRRSYSFKVQGKDVKAIDACRRYLELLDKLVHDFIAA